VTETDLKEYYSRRAAEYERVYEKPERQGDLAALKERLRRLLQGRHVLEIACGTGYWTEAIAPAARSVFATDVSPESLEIARGKPYPPNRVRFDLADAYRLDAVAGDFTACLAAFWWSHVPKQDLAGFLDGLHRRLGGGARVVFADNRYVEGSSTPITHRDDDGNTYQDRTLRDGGRFRVLKNFPAENEIARLLRGQSADLEFTTLDYYWILSYSTMGTEVP